MKRVLASFCATPRLLIMMICVNTPCHFYVRPTVKRALCFFSSSSFFYRKVIRVSPYGFYHPARGAARVLLPLSCHILNPFCSTFLVKAPRRIVRRDRNRITTPPPLQEGRNAERERQYCREMPLQTPERDPSFFSPFRRQVDTHPGAL